MTHEALIALYQRAFYENAIADGELLSDIPYKSLDGRLRGRWLREAEKATRYPYLIPVREWRDSRWRWVWEEKV